MPRRLPILLGLAIALLLAGIAVWFGLESHRVSRDADRLAAESSTLVAKARARTEGADTANVALANPARTEGADTANVALANPARTAELTGALRPIIEKVLSYDYRDLDGTAKAVTENLSGRALCEYDRLFGEIKRVAAEQRIVLASKVRELGVTRLEGDRASVLVFVDQSTTRGDNATSASSGAQLGFQADRQNGRWKITRFDMLNQAPPAGGTGPQC
jgi:hypothetical protein